MGGGTDGTSYISNADLHRYVRYLYWNDGAWQVGYNWLDNEFDEQNPAVLRATLFISPHVPVWTMRSFVYCIHASQYHEEKV
jgi:hypothetical protein